MQPRAQPSRVCSDLPDWLARPVGPEQLVAGTWPDLVANTAVCALIRVPNTFFIFECTTLSTTFKTSSIFLFEDPR